MSMLCEGISMLSYYDGLKYKGCPICRLINNLERKSIKNILYELSLDPKIREKFIRSSGLCPYHAWLFLEIAIEEGDKLGASVIYESVIKEHLLDLEEKYTV